MPAVGSDLGPNCLQSLSAHQDNMSVCSIPPYTPLLYGKNGVYRVLHYFLIFALKHILWVLVRTAICFEQKYENIQKNSTENCHFYSREKTLYIAWACFRYEKTLAGKKLKTQIYH